MKLSTLQRESQADNLLADLASAICRTYSGSVPANPQEAISGQTLLAEFTLQATAGTQTGGVITIDVDPAVEDTSGNASGTPTFVRVLYAGGASGVIADCTAGVGSGDFNFNGAIVSGLPVTLNSASFTQPE